MKIEVTKYFIDKADWCEKYLNNFLMEKMPLIFPLNYYVHQIIAQPLRTYSIYAHHSGDRNFPIYQDKRI